MNDDERDPVDEVVRSLMAERYGKSVWWTRKPEPKELLPDMPRVPGEGAA